VAEAGRRRGLEVPPADAVQETPGLGVAGRVEGQAVEVGSAAYLASRGIPVPDSTAECTTAFVAIDGRLAGAITFADRLRHQVPALLQRLTLLGVTETVMLTGDRLASAEAIAGQAGIRTVRANLPAKGGRRCPGLKRRHRDVVMVGDGINDAGARIGDGRRRDGRARYGGVRRGGHRPAGRRHRTVGDAIAISQRMRRIILQSIAIGLGVRRARWSWRAWGTFSVCGGAAAGRSRRRRDLERARAR
jgi:cation transport ATPase